MTWSLWIQSSPCRVGLRGRHRQRQRLSALHNAVHIFPVDGIKSSRQHPEFHRALLSEKRPSAADSSWWGMPRTPQFPAPRHVRMSSSAMHSARDLRRTANSGYPRCLVPATKSYPGELSSWHMAARRRSSTT